MGFKMWLKPLAFFVCTLRLAHPSPCSLQQAPSLRSCVPSGNNELFALCAHAVLPGVVPSEFLSGVIPRLLSL